MKLRGTSDVELADFINTIKTKKGGPTFAGVFSNDQLKKPVKNKIYILNLEDSNEPGSHWVLLYNGWYFDPYGVMPTAEIAPFTTNYNQNDFQGINSEACGHYCAYVASRIILGQTPYTGILVPNKSRINENVLEDFFRGSLME